MNKIDILYQSSSAYAIPAAVSICSLLDNNKDIERIILWYIDDGLSEKDRLGIQRLIARYGRELHFLSGIETDKYLESSGVRKWSGSYATFYKLFLCQEVKDADRVLYIDADTLVKGSIKELCEIPLEGWGCAMVCSAMCSEVRAFLNLKEYYNAGMELFNLVYWKQHHIRESIIKTINSTEFKKATVVADESLINVVLKGHIKKMPLKFDCEATWWLWGQDTRFYERLGWKTREDAFYSVEEVRRAYNNPTIIHFMDLTTGRPWDRYNDHPFRKDFEYYLSVLSPWKAIDLKNKGLGGDSSFLLWLKYIIKRIMPFNMRRELGFRQHVNGWQKIISELERETNDR